jgi:hypothetical protein
MPSPPSSWGSHWDWAAEHQVKLGVWRSVTRNRNFQNRETAPVGSETGEGPFPCGISSCKASRNNLLRWQQQCEKWGTNQRSVIAYYYGVHNAYMYGVRSMKVQVCRKTGAKLWSTKRPLGRRVSIMTTWLLLQAAESPSKTPAFPFVRPAKKWELHRGDDGASWWKLPTGCQRVPPHRFPFFFFFFSRSFSSTTSKSWFGGEGSKRHALDGVLVETTHHGPFIGLGLRASGVEPPEKQRKEKWGD